MKTYEKITLENIRNNLGSLIKPYFDSGKIKFVTSGLFADKTSTEGDVSLENGLDGEVDYLSADDINFESEISDYYSKMLKNTNSYVEDYFDFATDELAYQRFRRWFKKSLFDGSRYATLWTNFPIKIDLNGTSVAVARHTVGIVLPETEYKKLQQKAESGSYKRMRLAVSGPSTISGGKAMSMGGRAWLEYNTLIFVDAYKFIELY